MNKYTLTQAKSIQDTFSKILQDNTDLDNRGLCYAATIISKGNLNYYYINRILIDNDSIFDHGIGDTFGLNPERVMFLILFTTVSPKELMEMLNYHG